MIINNKILNFIQIQIRIKINFKKMKNIHPFSEMNNLTKNTDIYQ